MANVASVRYFNANSIQAQINAAFAVANQQTWWAAQANLSNGNNLLNKLLNGGTPSPPCQTDLTSLMNIGASSVGIVAMSNTVNWVNAATDTSDLAIGLFSPNDPNYAFDQQHLQGVTVAKYVSGGTTATAASPGSALWGNIYFSPSFVAGLSAGNAAALLMHELIHTLGPTDPQIQTALFGQGSPQVGAPSDNITQKLLTDCFK